MSRSIVTTNNLVDFLTSLDAAFGLPGTVHLIGETSQVLEGWRRWTTEIELCSTVRRSDRPAFNQALREVAEAAGVSVNDEHPSDVIPLPEGHADRALATSTQLGLTLDVLHFDPYSVAFRFLARGSEPDYHLALNYIHHDWIVLETMHDLLEGLLPAFSFSTIQQDPAEFRRRYGGLMQMVKTLAPGVTHRPTPV
jgi:hypothetical protein